MKITENLQTRYLIHSVETVCQFLDNLYRYVKTSYQKDMFPPDIKPVPLPCLAVECCCTQLLQFSSQSGATAEDEKLWTFCALDECSIPS